MVTKPKIVKPMTLKKFKELSKLLLPLDIKRYDYRLCQYPRFNKNDVLCIIHNFTSSYSYGVLNKKKLKKNRK